MIYIADADWRPSGANPFHADAAYGADWSAFVYDPSILYFTNVSPQAQLHTLRFSPQADKDRLRLFDFFSYEESYRRNVIFQPCEGMDAELLLLKYASFPRGISFRSTDEPYMVHSTTEENFENIQREGALLSPNSLKKQGIKVVEIGLKQMLEPADYSDYVMLDVLNGCSELVVNSRRLGQVCTDPDREYTPGVRLYFDVKKIIESGMAVRDGLHLLKVKDRLPLEGYLAAAITADDFPKGIRWTPTLFTEKANQLFLRKYADRRL